MAIARHIPARLLPSGRVALVTLPRDSGVNTCMNDQSHPHYQEACFQPGQYLLGLLLQARQLKARQCIAHSQLGEVIIDPAGGRFYSLSSDLAALCCAPASELQLYPYPPLPPSDCRGRDLEELLWHAAWHASEGRLLPDTSRYDVLELLDWPNLTRLPATPECMHLCALLTRQPHSLHLASRLLCIAPAEAARFYSAALSAGLVRQLSHTASPAAVDEQAHEEHLSSEPQSSLLALTLRSLWNKLTGKH